MSKTDNKQAQQNYGRFHSLVALIQRHPYISLAIPSSIFIFVSLAHLLVNDKTLQTFFQVIVYISGIIIGAILLLIADNQRKADSSKINLIFLYGIFPAVLLGFVYFSKIIGDASAIFAIATQIALAIYAKTGKSKESDVQENLSDPSPKFVQKNSPASIQNNSPVSIQNNNNSPISIQNNINTIQNVTNIIDELSERERITTNACKMLNSKDLASRISAVKTLANMADSWLEDSPNCKKDEKKCQDIIDILCAYIRSPFPLAEKRSVLELDSKPDNYEGKFTEDQTRLFEEQEVRRSIFNEISIRLHPLDEKEKQDYVTWHDFEFDFRKSIIFYPLTRLRFSNSDFRNSKFFGLADFSFSDFQEVSLFTGSHYFGDAFFSGARFHGTALFSGSCFEKELNFQATTLKAGAIFDSSIFKGSAIITPAIQGGQVSFDGAYFNYSSVHKFVPKFLNFNHPDIPKIDIKSVTLLGKRRCKRFEAKIPVNSHLYDPDSWDEKKQEYTRISKPAE